MENSLSIVGWVFFGGFLGAIIVGYILLSFLRKSQEDMKTLIQQQADQLDKPIISELIQQHFHSSALDDITISERRFPFRVRADLQRAIDQLFSDDTTIHHFCGIKKEYSHEELTLTDCIIQSEHYSTVSVPAQYEEIDVGDQEPVRCLKNGLWFLEKENYRFVVLLAPEAQFGQTIGIQFQIATLNDAAGTKISQAFFKHLEDSVIRAESYRGKILSLEQSPHSYAGSSSGIKVHKLRTVQRDQVILPKSTLDLLDRNLIDFVRYRDQLSNFKQGTKKGLLFYGPPGTGKTHTIHYLAKALPGHTSLLITAEQVGLLSEYMTLARLLQPSIVIMEDVDLIARDRKEMGVCEEVILNKLLNEMDGLQEEADILFILTTNRPEALELALSSRPGRIDQAIEFPLPDEEGRAKLVRLYSQEITIEEPVVAELVKRTDKVSAAFIKELVRRSLQFHLEREGADTLELPDIELALEEMLFKGGSLNLKLLGAEGADLNEHS